jgi:hypothetical protein
MAGDDQGISINDAGSATAGSTREPGPPADFEALRQQRLREFEAWMFEHPEAS